MKKSSDTTMLWHRSYMIVSLFKYELAAVCILYYADACFSDFGMIGEECSKVRSEHLAARKQTN